MSMGSSVAYALGEMTVGDAVDIATAAHGEQRDRDGSLHISHVHRVAGAVLGRADYQRVALLHDVLEDGVNCDPAEILSRLHTNEAMALRLLTRERGQTYGSYIAAICEARGHSGHLARVVKEADLLDNLARCVDAKDFAVERYGQALARLWRANTMRGEAE